MASGQVANIVKRKDADNKFEVKARLRGLSKLQSLDFKLSLTIAYS